MTTRSELFTYAEKNNVVDLYEQTMKIVETVLKDTGRLCTVHSIPPKLFGEAGFDMDFSECNEGERKPPFVVVTLSTEQKNIVTTSYTGKFDDIRSLYLDDYDTDAIVEKIKLWL